MRTDSLKSLCAPLLLACALLASPACVYRMPIQQGNFLEKTQVDQVEPGMTRPQVLFLLGTPMVPNGFDADRWDYYYYAKFSRKYAADTLRMTVYFKDDKVDHVDKPKVPEAPPASTEQQVEKLVEEATGPEKAVPAEQPPLPTLPVQPAVPGPVQ
jgi:outer membrane protein assembly factor BamE (lipoprotein component of BamABCDE complex)